MRRTNQIFLSPLESLQEYSKTTYTAQATTDSRITPMTVSNDVVLPNSKQGTHGYPSAKSYESNIATNQPNEMFTRGAEEPVPFATNSLYTTLFPLTKTLRMQAVCNIASLQFFDALGKYVTDVLDTTSEPFDGNPLFSGHKRIPIKKSYGAAVWHD